MPDHMTITDVEFIEKDGRVLMLGTQDFFDSDEGKELAKALRRINKKRAEQ